MPGSRRQASYRIPLLMWCSLLLTVPSWIYGIINIFYSRAFNDQLIETGSLEKIHFLAIASILLPVFGLLLVLVARMLIGIQKSKYNFYPIKSNQLLYNNILIGYFIVLFIIGFIYLEHN